ncbi:hypothetical protein BJX68DRAFT_42877 [Aspergillus pseudodeflectus]|uniref:Uncharacterized protein n=1 Tax=Aspergillus pseudodeflectus TaxID=176178 RepID=A0ABR4J7Z1_9EURO
MLLKQYLQLLEMAVTKLQDPIPFQRISISFDQYFHRRHCGFVGTIRSPVAPRCEFVIALCSIAEHVTCAKCFDKHCIDGRFAYQVQRLSCFPFAFKSSQHKQAGRHPQKREPNHVFLCTLRIHATFCLPCVSRQGAVNVGMLGSSVHVQEAYSNQEP